MKRFFVIAFAAIITGCSTMGSSPNGQIKAAYDTTNAYVELTSAALQRGRITPEQAAKASANAKKAREAVDRAAIAFAQCASPCLHAGDIVKQIQPALLLLEAELREREKEQGK